MTEDEDEDEGSTLEEHTGMADPMVWEEQVVFPLIKNNKGLVDSQ